MYYVLSIAYLMYVSGIMFSAGIGQMDAAHSAKGDPDGGRQVGRQGKRAGSF